MESQAAPPGTDNPQAEAGPSGQGDGGGEDPNSKKKANSSGTNRKRTKTGCLTCRKRRIKCDEGRPTCNNCIKSKRSCEGYNQRVIFKDPIGAHPFSGPFGHLGYIEGATHPLSDLTSQQARSSGRGPLPTIAPRPPTFDYQHQSHGFQYGVPFQPGLQGQAHLIPHAGFDFSTNPYNPANAYTQQPGPLAPTNTPPTYPQIGQQLHAGNFPSVAASQYYIPEETNHPGQNAAFDYSASQPIPTPEPPTISTRPPQPQQQNESSDEDASMEDSDDGDQNSKDLMDPVIRGMHGRKIRDASPRSFSTFARNDMLGEYMSSPHATELKDDAKRKLFEHFMRITGPTMSLYERHPFDPAEREMADTTSDNGSNIWSYTFPLLSFQHPALLHAILSLASLQVSQLQQTPATAAHKHYHIALRRVARNVRTPVRRLQAATLAATLLLAYFEVWNSEHTKWCSHLYGARTLFAEIPLRDMARRCLPAKSLKERQNAMKSMGLAGIGGPLPCDPNALDFDLLTTITGYHMVADDYGLREDQIFQGFEPYATEKDVEKFENLRDLYWWYCKMDVYQTVLGGTKLFMDYEHWTQCLPRAPASKLDAIYGTYDHLMLLLGRLAKFAAGDLPRKRRAARAKGPPPGGTSPPFAGMLPTQGTFRPPMGFSPPRATEPQNDPSDDTGAQASYQAALQEWEYIRNAFNVLENHLGPEFRPLSVEYTDRRDQPFGPVLQYRTYSVAGIWMNLYMGLIHLHRSHPDMPPAAMLSVGFAARKTAGFAIQIGRIAVGLSDDCSMVTEISTVLAAAFLESALCLFVAAVQFQDDSQRQWVVRRMHDITRLTGWKSARQIADGCESSWIKAAQLGRGPPYVRPADPNDTEHFIWNRPRRIDRRIDVEYTGGNEHRIVLAGAERAHYALGLLGVEEDLEYLELKDDTFNREGGNGS